VRPAPRQHLAPAACLHPRPEPVLLHPPPLPRLIRSLGHRFSLSNLLL
jgi:hypothetical protein